MRKSPKILPHSIMLEQLVYETYLSRVSRPPPQLTGWHKCRGVGWTDCLLLFGTVLGSFGLCCRQGVTWNLLSPLMLAWTIAGQCLWAIHTHSFGNKGVLWWGSFCLRMLLLLLKHCMMGWQASLQKKLRCFLFIWSVGWIIVRGAGTRTGHWAWTWWAWRTWGRGGYGQMREKAPRVVHRCPPSIFFVFFIFIHVWVGAETIAVAVQHIIWIFAKT